MAERRGVDRHAGPGGGVDRAGEGEDAGRDAGDAAADGAAGDCDRRRQVDRIDPESGIVAELFQRADESVRPITANSDMTRITTTEPPTILVRTENL
jgi:hypothetical protein